MTRWLPGRFLSENEAVLYPPDSRFQLAQPPLTQDLFLIRRREILGYCVRLFGQVMSWLLVMIFVGWLGSIPLPLTGPADGVLGVCLNLFLLLRPGPKLSPELAGTQCHT